MQWSISEMVNARAFKPLPLCLVLMKTYLGGLLEISKQKKVTFSAKTSFEKIQWSISEMVNTGAFTPLPLYSASLKTYLLGFLEL